MRAEVGGRECGAAAGRSGMRALLVDAASGACRLKDISNDQGVAPSSPSGHNTDPQRRTSSGWAASRHLTGAYDDDMVHAW